MGTRIAHCITRLVEGGALRVMQGVIRGLPDWEHRILAGPEDAVSSDQGPEETPFRLRAESEQSVAAFRHLKVREKGDRSFLGQRLKG